MDNKRIIIDYLSLTFPLDLSGDENERIKEIFGIKHFQKLNVVRGERTIFNVSITTEKEIASDEIDSIMKNNDFILSIERCDD